MTDPDFLDSHAPIEGEVVTAEAWPMPPKDCPYCTSDDAAVRGTFCNATCAGCLTRHFDAPPKEKTLSERLWELVAGRAG